MNPIELSLFSSRVESICEEMGAALKRAAFSPNIKDRLDFSCAVFDVEGQLTAQAAHIPVHLGSMAYAMADIVSDIQWQPGDMVVMNDPFKGGTHLPDVTVIAPVFVQGACIAFVANRAHHANIGASSPGSMPVSTHIEQEGVVIEPTLLVKQGQWQAEVLAKLSGVAPDQLQQVIHSPAVGDFSAQVSANRTGVSRLQQLIESYGRTQYDNLVLALNEYAHQMAINVFLQLPDGTYHFSDRLDDDGAGNTDLPICALVSIIEGHVNVDFAGSSPQVAGNVNCPLSVVAAAVFYVFRCLMPQNMPVCAGAFRAISIQAELGSMLNAVYPAAVAAGNVETSTRIVDVILGALSKAIPERIPAASHGSMNNVAMGAIRGDGSRWDYYETMGGGMGASSLGAGQHAVQTHMTNTLNTPVESLESHYPLRVIRYEIRRGSGGQGKYSGGDGLIREIVFTESATVSLLTERRRSQPWGLGGGEGGEAGCNALNGSPLPAKTTLQVTAGDRLSIETPGGGAWGKLS